MTSEIAKVNWKPQFFLALLLFIGGSFVYWYEFKHKPSIESEETNTSHLVSLDGKRIKGFSIKSSNKKVLDVQCESEQGCFIDARANWKVAVPINVIGDRSNINSFLNSLKTLKASETIDLSSDDKGKQISLFKEYGIDSEKNASIHSDLIKIDIADDESILMLKGATHPVGNKIFVAITRGDKILTDQILLLPSFFNRHFERSVTHWRDKKIFNLAVEDILGVSISARGKSKVVLNRDENTWLISDKNEKYPAEATVIEGLLNSITFTNAKEFLKENKYTADAKKLIKNYRREATISLNLKDGGIEKFELFSKKPGEKEKSSILISSKLDPIYEVDSTFPEKFAKSAVDFRMKRLISSSERFNVSKVEVKTGKEAFQITKNESNWTWNENLPLDADKVNSLLDAMSSDQILDTLDPKTLPKGESVSLLLKSENDQTLKRIEFWKVDTSSKEKSGLIAKLQYSERSQVFSIDKRLDNAIPWTKETLKPTQENHVDRK